MALREAKQHYKNEVIQPEVAAKKYKNAQGFNEWTHYDKYTVKGDMIFTPKIPETKELKQRLNPLSEMVTLVPYGCTKLRVTIFHSFFD